MCVFFNDTATTEIYTLSLHDALPIFGADRDLGGDDVPAEGGLQGLERAEEVGPLAVEHVHEDQPRDVELFRALPEALRIDLDARSEEHTSELQSRQYLVCRLLLEKKK